MSAATYPRLAAVNGVLLHPAGRATVRRRARAGLGGLTPLQAAIRDAEAITRTCEGIREAVRAFVTAARTGDLILVRALSRDLDIEAGCATHAAENLARRLEELNAGGGA